MTKLNKRFPQDNSFIFPCDCVGYSHYLRFFFDDEDTEWASLYLETGINKFPFFMRVKKAIAILFNRPIPIHEIILNKDEIIDVKNAMEKFLANTTSESQNTK